MPRLGESVSEGTVTRWLKKEGERVETDEPLLEVSTDKVDTEIPSPAAGVISTIRVSEDETVEVGAELAVIDEAGTGGGAGAGGQEQAQAEPEQAQAEPERQPEPEHSRDVVARVDAEPGDTSGGDAPAAGSMQDRMDVAAEPDAVEARPTPPAQADGPRQQGGPPVDAPQTSGKEGPDDGDGGGGAYVTPLVRKLAAERGVDLSSIRGTGVGGRVRKQDVLDAAPSGAATNGDGAPRRGAAASADTAAGEGREELREPVPAGVTSAPRAEPTAPQVERAVSRTHVRGRTEKLSRLRTVIARRMTESLQVSAQLTTVVEADITKTARLRVRGKAGFEAREGVKLSFLPFFAVAACEALKAHPQVNSSIDLDAGTVTYHDAVHLGIAVDTDRGLLVPVIQNAGDLNLGGVARKIADLAERTRRNQVAPDELGGGTFTLTNTGSRGALFDTPIINQPQVGILGTGAAVKRPAVVDHPELGEVVAVRSMVYLALTYDHRIVDGADAARFLTTVKERLEEGAFEADLGL
jgi:2-oxoglutarate dehydrogenase E2 component (dihydrolipoamide succinyltransferase)